MSPRKRTPRASSGKPVLRTDVPALVAFLSGYLHQDLLEEHASPEAALHAFMAVASPAERERLAADWHTFYTRTAAWPLTAVRRALADLGSAWVPPTRSRLEALFATIPRLD
jgi:CdiI immunity protein